MTSTMSKIFVGLLLPITRWIQKNHFLTTSNPMIFPSIVTIEVAEGWSDSGVVAKMAGVFTGKHFVGVARLMPCHGNDLGIVIRHVAIQLTGVYVGIMALLDLSTMDPSDYLTMIRSLSRHMRRVFLGHRAVRYRQGKYGAKCSNLVPSA